MEGRRFAMVGQGKDFDGCVLLVGAKRGCSSSGPNVGRIPAYPAPFLEGMARSRALVSPTS